MVCRGGVTMSTYVPTIWVNTVAPAINSTNLNHAEAGVELAHVEIEEIVDGTVQAGNAANSDYATTVDPATKTTVGGFTLVIDQTDPADIVAYIGGKPVAVLSGDSVSYDSVNDITFSIEGDVPGLSYYYSEALPSTTVTCPLTSAGDLLDGDYFVTLDPHSFGFKILGNVLTSYVPHADSIFGQVIYDPITGLFTGETYAVHSGVNDNRFHTSVGALFLEFNTGDTPSGVGVVSTIY